MKNSMSQRRQKSLEKWIPIYLEYVAGKTAIELASDHGMKVHRVYKIVDVVKKHFEAQTRANERDPEVTRVRDEAVFNLVEAGYSEFAIGNDFGMSPRQVKTVHRRVRSKRAAAARGRSSGSASG